MNLLSSLQTFTSKATNAFLRFPITIIWAILGSSFVIWFTEQKIDQDLEFNYIKIILTIILGISWLIGTRLLILYFRETQEKNKYWLTIIPLLLLALYYYMLSFENQSFDNITIPYRFTLYLIAGHLFILFSPFLFMWDKNAYWNYLKSIYYSISKSILFSVVIFIGLSLALLALKYLFHFEFKEKIYFELFVISLGIINTWIFVADLPKQIHNQSKVEYPMVLEIFVKYILIPLTVLYLIILYAYGFKILLLWSLPKGWVSYLVIALALLGFLVHILINPVRKTIKSTLIKRFYPWFYYALLPMIGLLFIAIWKRISEYGFTENRYFVLLLAFWILGMTLYIIFSKHKKLRYFPMSVTILSLLVSFGFWGAFSISENSQLNQFRKAYDEMKTNNFEVKQSERLSFESTARYLKERNALHKVKDIIGYDPSKAFFEDKYATVNRMIDSLGIKIVEFDKYKDDYGYEFFNSNQNSSFDIRGYDYFRNIYLENRRDIQPARISKHTYSQNSYDLSSIITDKSTYHFQLDSLKESIIDVYQEEKLLHEIDINTLLDSLQTRRPISEKHFTNFNNARYLEQKDMTVEKEFADLNIKFIFHNIEIQTKEDNINIPRKLTSLGFTVFLKEK